MRSVPLRHKFMHKAVRPTYDRCDYGQCDSYLRGSNGYMHQLPRTRSLQDAKNAAIDVAICHLSKFGDSTKFVIFGGRDLKPLATISRQEVMKVIDDASR